MKFSERIAHELYMQNNGGFVMNTVQRLATYAIGLKVFGVPRWAYLVGLPAIFLLTRAVGWAYQHWGVRRYYDLIASKYVIGVLKGGQDATNR